LEIINCPVISETFLKKALRPSSGTETNLTDELLGYSSLGKGKGKALPLQTLTGPEGSSTLRLPDFKTIGTWW
jgi:hypothetical protein